LPFIERAAAKESIEGSWHVARSGSGTGGGDSVNEETVVEREIYTKYIN